MLHQLISSAMPFHLSSYLSRKVAEQGRAIAQRCLGYFYFDDELMQADGKEAVRWFLKADEQGCPSGQMFLSSMGGGFAIGEKEAVRWHPKAAEQGPNVLS